MTSAAILDVSSPGVDRPHGTLVVRKSVGQDGARRARSGDHNRALCVAVVDECPLIVHGVRAMLVRDDRTFRVHAAEPGARGSDPVDITLVDPSRPGPATCVTLDTLVRDPNRGRVVVFSFDPPRPLVSYWLARGCAGFLDKGAPRAEFVDVLTSVATTEPAVEWGAHTALTHPCPPDTWPGKAHGLSRRESQIICLISSGLTNHDICEQAFLSMNTVKTYVRSAYHKLGVSRRSEAVRWGVQNGMLDPTARYVAATTDSSHYQGRSA